MVISIFAGRLSASTERLTLEEIRHRLHQALSDCKDMAAQRVIYRINVATTPSELWLLRCDLHQCISRTHNQAEASKRVNELLDAFKGWVPARQLTPI